jgi:hypothetical protein
MMTIAAFALALPITASAAPLTLTGAIDADGADWWKVLFGSTGSIAIDGGWWDTQVFVFLDSGSGVGAGVVANDVTAPGQPTISGILPGAYYVAVTKNNQDPVNGSNNPIFPDVQTQTGPIPGSGNFAGWVNGYGSQLTGLEYQITFDGHTGTPINGQAPEPGTLLLMGTGFAALARRMRRRQAASAVSA